jgi:excisionase family DNA binding protein
MKKTEWLSAAQAAPLLGWTTGWLYEKAKTGEIPSVQIGRSRIFNREDLLRALEERKRGRIDG